MFEKSLQDLIKGVRNHKRDTASYVSKAMVEIRKELRSTDRHVKFVAVQKVTYLQMLGIDVGFASFHVIEVMSAPRFAHRRAGMLAASQIFDENTDVILLCTNLLKKELHATDPFEAGSALNCLSNIATKELSRDLLEDVAVMLNSTKPLVRKKAVLTLYKMYTKYPQGLPQTFDRLRQRLEDPDSSVVSCTVNVICELSRKNPRNFLALAPQLFQLLTSSSNNWMLIKIVKLMSALLPEEPRLARKLLEPLAEVVRSTQAKSLLYECIHTITQALPYTARADGSQPKVVPNIVTMCTIKLREFVEDPDQNLKYLGLVGLVNLMRSHPRVVAEHKEMVLRCLMDDDVTVRLRALELLTGMVTKRNLPDIVQKLLQHVMTAEGHYRERLIEKIVFMCSREKYKYLSNFAWYVSVLVDLAHINSAPEGELIRTQLLDVTMRVPTVRPFAVRAMYGLLCSRKLVTQRGHRALESDGTSHVLFAASWIACEYAGLLDKDISEGEMEFSDRSIAFTTRLSSLVDVLLAPETQDFSPFVQAAFVHNALKLLVTAASHELENATDRDVDVDAGWDRVRALAHSIGRKLEPFRVSEFIQVQERAVTAQELLALHGLLESRELESGETGGTSSEAERIPLVEEVDLLFDTSTTSRDQAQEVSLSAERNGGVPALDRLRDVAEPLGALFAGKLAPVGSSAQSRVPVPQGLDLEEPLVFANESTKGNARGSRIGTGFEFTKQKRQGILRVSFAAVGGEAATAAVISKSADDTDDDQEDVDLMLEDGSRKQRKKMKRKAKGKKGESVKHNRKDASQDPFYLDPASPDIGGEELNGQGDRRDSPPRGPTPEASTSGPETINSLSARAIQPSVSNVVLEEDIMPEGAVSDEEASKAMRGRRRGKDGDLEEEEETLETISLVGRGGGQAGQQALDTSSPAMPVTEKKPKKSKKSRHARNEAGAEGAKRSSTEKNVEKHKKKKKKKRHKDDKARDGAALITL
ncbi:AP-3 complex subunit delta-1 (AP-3 complex subunit delta) (Adaptor-related protein complex 3 subunit delta-1) (Delta-adaptin) (mBLVR1) [Durusdinium trenchii]|uniref:AP-3 complex subunit delta n=1 Tax=Durusdinium trenchii TaxID=1381693 RepID=A0ABP0JBC6_9DINO